MDAFQCVIWRLVFRRLDRDSGFAVLARSAEKRGELRKLHQIGIVDCFARCKRVATPNGNAHHTTGWLIDESRLLEKRTRPGDTILVDGLQTARKDFASVAVSQMQIICKHIVKIGHTMILAVLQSSQQGNAKRFKSRNSHHTPNGFGFSASTFQVLIARATSFAVILPSAASAEMAAWAIQRRSISKNSRRCSRVSL